jgi:hypothetical protein
MRLAPSLYGSDDGQGFTASSTQRFAGIAFSLMLLAASAFQLDRVEFDTVFRAVPADALFWPIFGIYYLSGPLVEYMIYQRLWKRAPGLLHALVRKLLANELLVGLAGDAALFAWARGRGLRNPDPFGAIKDVALLSGLIGNCATILLTALASYWLYPLVSTQNAIPVILGVASLIIPSILVILFRGKLFSLSPRERWIISAWHGLRVVTQIVLLALLWWLLLPDYAVIWLVCLAALRLLVSRLPFIPNLDVTFAGLTVLIAGPNAPVAAAMITIAALVMFTHLCVAAILGINTLRARVQF